VRCNTFDTRVKQLKCQQLPGDNRLAMSKEDVNQKLKELRELRGPISNDPLFEYDGEPLDPAFENWHQEFVKRDPLVTMIIQGHVLLERDLNAFIAKAFKNPEAIAGTNFYWKVQLVKAIHPIGHHPGLWRLIDLLNRLRNLVAHPLSANNSTMRITILNELREGIEPSVREKFNRPELELDDETLIEMAFAYATGVLGSMIADLNNSQSKEVVSKSP
jgi:hypothetical protein